MLERFEEFVGIISNIYKDIQKIKKNKMKAFGLSGNHVMTLFYLSQHPEGLTAAKLSALISIDKAATSRVIAELLEKGYVCYPKLGEGKKYRTLITLTEKGEVITKEIDEIIVAVVAEAGENLSNEDRICMYQSLEAISKNLDKLACEE